MTPSHRVTSHIELVAGQSEINSFEHDIERGRLGTTRGAHEVHPHDTLWNHKKLWLAVVGRAAKDAGEIEMEDLEVVDEPESPVAAKNPTALGDRYDARFDGKEWFHTPEFRLVMEFVGLEPVAPQIARMPPAEIVANLHEFEKREERERKEKRK